MLAIIKNSSYAYIFEISFINKDPIYVNPDGDSTP